MAILWSFWVFSSTVYLFSELTTSIPWISSPSSSSLHMRPHLLRFFTTVAIRLHSFTLWLAIPTILCNPFMVLTTTAKVMKVSVISEQSKLMLESFCSGFLRIVTPYGENSQSQPSWLKASTNPISPYTLSLVNPLIWRNPPFRATCAMSYVADVASGST